MQPLTMCMRSEENNNNNNNDDKNDNSDKNELPDTSFIFIFMFNLTP